MEQAAHLALGLSHELGDCRQFHHAVEVEVKLIQGENCIFTEVFLDFCGVESVVRVFPVLIIVSKCYFISLCFLGSTLKIVYICTASSTVEWRHSTAFGWSSSLKVVSWIIRLQFFDSLAKSLEGRVSPEQLTLYLVSWMIIPKDCGQWMTLTGLKALKPCFFNNFLKDQTISSCFGSTTSTNLLVYELLQNYFSLQDSFEHCFMPISFGLAPFLPKNPLVLFAVWIENILSISALTFSGFSCYKNWVKRTLHPQLRSSIVLQKEAYQLYTLNGMMRYSISQFPKLRIARFLSDMKLRMPRL